MIVQVDSLIKKYGDLRAVEGISFDVAEGSLFAFLGPNGAGKSTTINIICTLLEKTEGRILVAGYEVGREDRQVRQEIGLVFQESILDGLLSVYENLELRARFYGMSGKTLGKRMKEIAEMMDIGEILRRPYGRLSGGQRRRVDIARALVNTPRILFLDEPTTGLDPQTRIKVWETVGRLQKEQKITVFLTTHYMEEAGFADDVAIIDKGRIVARGTPNELKDRYASDTLRLYTTDPAPLAQELSRIGAKMEFSADAILVHVQNSMKALEILKRLEPSIEGFEVVKGSMDDVFIAITGKTMREGGEE